MARKYLRDLLVEDQEPFLLDAYISDLRRQLNKPPRPFAHRKSASFRENLLKNANACFSSSSFRYNGSKQSSSLPPILSVTAARVGAKTVGNNMVLLHVPTQTAAMLLEAALRIESYGLKDCDPPDRKKQGKSGEGAGAGGSLFRKFARFGRRSRKKEFRGCEGDDGVLVREILGLDKYGQQQMQGKVNVNNSSITIKKASSYAGKGPCSTSETLEAHLYESEQIRGRETFGGSEGSGLGRSPFRYPTPELRSPTLASPTHSLPMVYQDKANEEESDPHEIQSDDKEEVEVEKEQSSPVSVLDPHSYHDDDVREHGYAEVPDDNDGYEYEYKNADRSVNYEASYTRTKQQLLQKLYMFERLAGLDPVVLKELSIGQEDGEDEDEDRDVRPGRGGDDSSWRMGVTRGMMKRVSDIVLGEHQEVKKQGDHVRVGMALQDYYRRNRMVRSEEEDYHLEDAAEEIEMTTTQRLHEASTTTTTALPHFG
ncbi:hypothetical protein MLD38_035463 [Melastoma candidum]|uniref:Uncharacterized protein n=1 Tax=Melastoma candidum TaxID=119954 RepID=A0ACB9LIH3_9MYRT|nr:hypothetical protein MLD38_035463 [Melastoma candidum]